jgi:hypothetical protein
MTDYQHQIDVMIAETLEKLQPLNPERYGVWYSKLYHPQDNTNYWNVRTLHTLEQLLIDYAV